MKNKILFAFLFILFLSIVNASSIKVLSIASNTIYQNTNSSPLYIYATTSSQLKGWLGASSNSLQLVINDQGQLVTTLTGVSLTYNDTTLLVVPPQWYYKFNFTSGNFIGEYISTPSPSAFLIPSIRVSSSQYSSTALWIYVFGMLFTLINIFNIFFYHEFEKIITGIKHFVFSVALGLFAASLIALSLYYTSTISVPQYNITNATSTLFTIHSISLTTQPLSANKTLALFSLGIMSIDLFSVLIFIFLLFFGNKRRREE